MGEVVRRAMRAAGVPDGNYARVDRMVASCERCVRCKPLVVDKNLMVFSDCVLDMSTMRRYSFTKVLVSVNGVDYPYEPYANCGLWLQFLQSSLPEPWKRDLLQEFLGSVFVDRRRVKLDKMLFLFGGGGSGKGVVCRVVRDLLGAGSVSDFCIGGMVKGVEGKRRVASANGMRLNLCPEIDTDDFRYNADKVKMLLSGEPLEGKSMGGAAFTAYDLPLFMAASDRLPMLVGRQNGMMRRILVIPFDAKIREEMQVRDLSDQLRGELPGIFLWALKGYERFKKNGYRFSVSNDMEFTAEGYLSDSSSALKFMIDNDYRSRAKEADEITPLWAAGRKLYQRYRIWCGPESLEPVTAVAFARALRESGYRSRRRSSGVEWAIYGKSIYKVFTVKKPKLANAVTDDAGDKWVYGMEHLAVELGLSRKFLSTLYRNGRFEGLWTEKEVGGRGFHKYFNVRKCRDVVRAELLAAGVMEGNVDLSAYVHEIPLVGRAKVDKKMRELQVRDAVDKLRKDLDLV